MVAHKTTRDEAEIEKFDRIASEWWDVNGKFSMLHKINPVRLEYIKKLILKHSSQKTFKGLKVLDIGCGGGLVSVPIYNMGADVTGLDASENNIKTAKAYAKRKNLDIKFVHSEIESLKSREKFDVILALEIVEHVSDYQLFLSQTVTHLKPGGLIIISTINRTPKSLLLAKFMAEYILRMVPAGTHDWNKFLKPSEIQNTMHELGLKQHAISGMTMNPLTCNWRMSKDTGVNYFVAYSS
jgi:2-polyprenyl-6-hydroxyphenyl methylase/3-demethylubiquinone-9 3-methyltransferase